MQYMNNGINTSDVISRNEAGLGVIALIRHTSQLYLTPKMRQHTVSRAWLWRLGSPWFGFLPSSKRKCCRGTGRSQAGSARCRPAGRGSPWRSSPAPPAPPRRRPRPPPPRPWGRADGRPARPHDLGGAEGRGQHGAEASERLHRWLRRLERRRLVAFC